MGIFVILLNNFLLKIYIRNGLSLVQEYSPLFIHYIVWMQFEIFWQITVVKQDHTEFLRLNLIVQLAYFLLYFGQYLNALSIFCLQNYSTESVYCNVYMWPCDFLRPVTLILHVFLQSYGGRVCVWCHIPWWDPHPAWNQILQEMDCEKHRIQPMDWWHQVCCLLQNFSL